MQVFESHADAEAGAQWWYERMGRVAELTEAIAERLYLKRNWTPAEQEQHRSDVFERETILIARRPSLMAVLDKAREIGLLDPNPVGLPDAASNPDNDGHSIRKSEESMSASGVDGVGTPEKMIAGEDGWSEWRHPLPGYRMVCCDCGLVHEMDFLILRDREELPDGAKAGTPVEDVNLQVVFRARRSEGADVAP